MAPPRFLFTPRVGLHSTPRVGLHSTHPVVSGGPCVAWRLVGGNNHELGRSLDGYADLEACVSAVRRLQREVANVEPTVAAEDGTAQWRWSLLLGDEVVATSSRWYRREREGEYNLAQFLTAVPVAGAAGVVGGPPPRRSLYRPEFVLPHVVPDEPVGFREGDAGPLAAEVQALTQDLPVDQVDELTEAM
jgi:hypothetical protein